MTSQAYLPNLYLETEADSTTLYLTFLRLHSKVDILISTVSQIRGLPTALHADIPGSQPLVGACELKGKMRDFSSLGRRFAAVMSRSQADEWAAYGKVLLELGGVEARVDAWISSIKSDEFNEKECAGQLARRVSHIPLWSLDAYSCSLTAQFDHLGSTTFARPDLDAPERQLSLAYTVDYDLDNFAAAVGFARQAVYSLAREPGGCRRLYNSPRKLTQSDIEVQVGDSSMEEGVYAPVQKILDQVRAVKVPSSLVPFDFAYRPTVSLTR